LKALVYWPLALEESKRIIKEGLSNTIEVLWASSTAEAMSLVGSVEIYIGSAQNWVLERGERLRFLQAVHAGVDNLDLELARRRGVMIASAKKVNSFYVAETALALMLSLAKKITYFDRLAKNNIFPQYSWEFSTDTLRDKTIIILGYGGIGRELARLLKPFGVRVIGVKRNPPGGRDPYADLVIGINDLDKYVGEADFLVVSAPLTRETRGLIDLKVISKMKRGSYIINVGRGHVIDERSLHMALREGMLRGAGLDVWWLYPHRGGDGVYSSTGIHMIDNVIATPHRGGFVKEAEIDIARFVVENVKRYLRGEEPEGLVDLESGY